MADGKRAPKVEVIRTEKIALSDRGWDAYCMRYRLDVGGIEESVKANGVIEPVTVEERRGGFRVISGFRRAAAARETGLAEVPAVVYPEGTLPPREALRIALAANAPGLSLDHADRAAALRKALEGFGFTPEELVDEVAPLVGLAASHKVVNQYLEIARLPDALLRALADGKISREHAVAVCLVPPGRREWFFAALVEPFRLSAGDTRLVAEAALDLAGRQGSGVREVLREVIDELEVSGVLPHGRARPAAAQRPKGAAQAKAALKTALARKLSPVIIEMEDEFTALVERLCPPGAVSIGHSANFEADEVTITLRAGDVEVIKALREALERGLADGVFEQMLSIARRKGRQILQDLRKGNDG